MSVNAPDISGLPDRYVSRRYLARGPNGVVIEAINKERGSSVVALKILRADGSRADVARAMFRREVEALKGLSHDAIVRIIDWFQGEDNLLGIELELIAGGHTLGTLLEEIRIGRTAPPPPEWRVRMAVRLLEAVLEAHRRDVIHRDIKPGNVLWDRDSDTLKLSDFGIAAVLSLTAREPGGPTLRSFYSRPYASPEQLLQRAPDFTSDVYSFALLMAALLAGSDPGEEFEPAGLSTLIGPFAHELAVAGAAAGDIVALQETLAQALLDDPQARPSLTAIRDVLVRLQGALVERPAAAVALTTKAESRLIKAGFVAMAKIVEDFNEDLRVCSEPDGDRIKIYGRTLYAVLKPSDDDPTGARELVAVDAGQNAGPVHASHRAKAEPCPVRVAIGRGSSTALVSFVGALELDKSRRATHAIIEQAELIIRIERERLPVFLIEGLVEGRRSSGGREDQIGRAAGYEGSQTEKVSVNGGFLVRATGVERVLRPEMKNAVRERQKAAGNAVASSEPDPDSEAEWHTLFDDLGDVDLIDEHQHMVGKVTGYEPDTRTLHVKTDKPRKLHRSGFFFVRDQQKERQLKLQEKAIEALARDEMARPDMRILLAEASAHTMGDKPWVELMQNGLQPEARVRDLVDRILASQSVFCLQGPPGTGKTTVIAEVVAQLLQSEPRSRILVCSQANDAVANAIERIRGVRAQLGRDWLIVRDVRDERARQEGDWAGYDAAYREFAERVASAARAAVAGNAPDHPARVAVDGWVEAVDNQTRNVRRDHRGLVQVWGTTTARAPQPLADLGGEAYDLVIIDEAAKATVGEVLVAIRHARRLLLVGDQKQLPPFLEDTTTEALLELGITEAEAKYSLFEHMFALVPRDHRDMLDMQFRMHRSIGDVVSRLFYDGKVRNGPGTDARPMPAGDFDRAHRVMWVDVVGSDYEVGKTSRANDEECGVIVRLLDALDADAKRAGRKLSVAVIAPYRGQVEALRRHLADYERGWRGLTVTAATVDAFQGREADVVLFSLVRTGPAERHFVADGRRFNVALSRAKSLLVMVGDLKGSRGTPMLQMLLAMIPDGNQVAAEAFVPEAAWRQRRASAQRAVPPRPGRK